MSWAAVLVIAVVAGFAGCGSSTPLAPRVSTDADGLSWAPDGFDCAPAVGQVTALSTTGRFVAICNEQERPARCVRLELSTGNVKRSVGTIISTASIDAHALDGGTAIAWRGGPTTLSPPEPGLRFVTNAPPLIALGDYLLAKVAGCGENCATGWLYRRSDGQLHGRLKTFANQQLNVFAASAIDVGRGDWLLGAGVSVAMVHPTSRSVRWGWEMADEAASGVLGRHPGIAPVLSAMPDGRRAAATFVAHGTLAAVVVLFDIDSGQAGVAYDIARCDRKPRPPRFERMITRAAPAPR